MWLEMEIWKRLYESMNFLYFFYIRGEAPKKIGAIFLAHFKMGKTLDQLPKPGENILRKCWTDFSPLHTRITPQTCWI